jgi:hypothetical protein
LVGATECCCDGFAYDPCIGDIWHLLVLGATSADVHRGVRIFAGDVQQTVPQGKKDSNELLADS